MCTISNVVSPCVPCHAVLCCAVHWPCCAALLSSALCRTVLCYACYTVLCMLCCAMHAVLCCAVQICQSQKLMLVCAVHLLHGGTQAGGRGASPRSGSLFDQLPYHSPLPAPQPLRWTHWYDTFAPHLCSPIWLTVNASHDTVGRDILLASVSFPQHLQSCCCFLFCLCSSFLSFAIMRWQQ